MNSRIGAVALCVGLASATLHAGAGDGGGVAADTDSKREVKAELAKPVVRGSIVYKNYCKLCHGEKGDGVSRASKLHTPEELVIGEGTPDYYEEIIRKGGEALGRSPYMPMWEQELSEEQIGDVTAYLSVVINPVARGEAVFKANCILCHGVRGDGKGRASVLYDPPPADLTRSDKNDMYKEMIITMGGKAMGRSEAMPIWGEQLTAQEIKDVVAYLRTIVVR